MTIDDFQDFGTPEKVNCLLGDKGRNRNTQQCDRRKSCAGCGWDKTEHRRRINAIRTEGLHPISYKQKERLLLVYHSNVFRPIFSAYVGKKKAEPLQK